MAFRSGDYMSAYIFGGLTTLFVLLVAAEVIARRWARSRDFFALRRWDRTKMRLKNGALPSLEPLIRFAVNGEGERGDPLPRDTEGLYRVLVAGGSAAECGLLDQQSAWPAVLQTLLRRPSNLRALACISHCESQAAFEGIGEVNSA